MKTRIISGTILTLLAGTCMILGGLYLLGLMIVMALIAFYELSKATGLHVKGVKTNAFESMAYVSIVVMYAFIYLDYVGIGLGIWSTAFLMCLLIIYVVKFPTYDASQMMRAFFCVMYGPFLFSYVYRIRALENGVYLVFLVLICSALNDTFAYFTGMAIGKHKLAPKLSPKKTIEGSIGGIIGGALGGGIYGWFLGNNVYHNDRMWWVLAIICGLASIIGQIGDLAASGIKRNYNIKDYGTIIPGHGGIMDRVDSIIVTAPIVYYLSILFMSLDYTARRW
ncbi:MAG: phosphatidate cytidylyltransferase [Lachnospiraceae bacterium]|nr:phosphatidate cytidylyltransferase [Lachnospiraceae bacterium]MBR4993708.1 phosphatidate cytidylyltransferase [Lachnospiraceae bacterium]